MARQILPPNVDTLASSINSKMVVGRVKDIVLSPNSNNFVKYGSFNAIGTISWEENGNRGGSKLNIAKPLFPQMSYFPLINELVLLFSLPNKNMGGLSSSETYYYVNIINIWNSNHHNGYPNPTEEYTPASQQKDYETTTAGSPVRRIDDDGTGLNLNNNSSQDQTFIERSNIHPIYPFPGDVLYQGRWGNSIRFGSTARPFDSNFIPLNNWSDVGENGDPITIIRNGQNKELKDEKKNPLPGYVNTIENIKGDLSSIYLTSYQKIKNLQIQNETFFSYYKGGQATFGLGQKLTPESPKEYSFPQVIINSDRLVFNAKEDHVLISGQKSVYLSSNESLNFDTKRFIVGAGEIKLGSPDATQPLVLGETLRFDLESITTALINIISILEVSSIYPGGAPVPDTITSLTAVQVKDLLKDVLKDFKRDSNGNSKILSKVSKTI
jgi:hypothetical protein